MKHTAHYDERSLHICNVAIKNQQLISACLDAGWVGEAKKLRQLDTSLAALFAMSARKAGFNPNQPRIPAGNPDGGQWTDDPRYGGSTPRDTQPHALEPEPIFIDEMPAIAEIPFERHEPIAGNKDVTYIKTIEHPTKGKVRKVNIFVGGLDDDERKHVRHSNALNRNTYGDNYYAEQDAKLLIQEMIERVPNDYQINLIGHSWGGDTATQVVEQLQSNKVDILITVDPVSLFHRPKYKKIIANTKRWINVNAVGRPGSSSEDDFREGNTIAGVGGSWDDAPEAHADIHIKAPHNHSNFNQLMVYKPANGIDSQTLLNSR